MMLSMTVSLWSRFVVLLTFAAFGSCLVLAFMEDGPYANTRHHAIRRLAAQAQQAANSVVTPAALGGQPSRRMFHWSCAKLVPMRPARPVWSKIQENFELDFHPLGDFSLRF